MYPLKNIFAILVGDTAVEIKQNSHKEVGVSLSVPALSTSGRSEMGVESVSVE